jgi:hypothetical protein
VYQGRPLEKGYSLKIRNFGTCLLALWVVACGGAAGTAAPQGTGQLELPLTAPGPNGQTYELVGATFTLTGPENVTITNTSGSMVSVPLSAGLYSIQLSGNYHLERVGAPGQAVPAQLISPNPLSFSIGEGEVRVVRFLFKIPGTGDADLGFSVDNGGWITGTLEISQLNPPGSDNLFTGLAGQSIPFTISFESAMLSREGGFQPALQVMTSPITLQFGGAPSQLLQERVIPALQNPNGPPFSFRLERMSNGQVVFSGFQLVGTTEPFAWRVFPSEPFAGALDADGFPKPQAFSFSNVPSVMEYFGASLNSADAMASGSVQPQ